MRGLPLFREMRDANFTALMKAAFLHGFPPGVVVITEGAQPDFLHVVVGGAVEMFASHDGRDTTLDIMRPVSTFILAAVVRDEVYLKSARTLLPSRVLMLPAERVREIFGRDAAFARAVVGELATRYRVLVRELKNHKLRTSVERLANWILRRDREQGEPASFLIGYDKRTLAKYLGMTPENLSRNLATLARHGVMTRGREVRIHDREALRRLAKPDVLIDE
jgi:CRP/FNR family transcriptional activator FtrB